MKGSKLVIRARRPRRGGEVSPVVGFIVLQVR
jgi:hypothetical protein